MDWNVSSVGFHYNLSYINHSLLYSVCKSSIRYLPTKHLCFFRLVTVSEPCGRGCICRSPYWQCKRDVRADGSSYIRQPLPAWQRGRLHPHMGQRLPACAFFETMFTKSAKDVIPSDESGDLRVTVHARCNHMTILLDPTYTIVCRYVSSYVHDTDCVLVKPMT